MSPLNNRDEYSNQLDKSTLSITSQCSRVSPTASVPSSRLRVNGKVSHESHVEQRVSFEDEIIDEKNKRLDNPNDLNDVTRRIEYNLRDRLKNSKVQSLRYVRMRNLRVDV